MRATDEFRHFTRSPRASGGVGPVADGAGGRGAMRTAEWQGSEGMSRRGAQRRSRHLNVRAGQAAERVEAERRVLHEDGALRLPGSQHALLGRDLKRLALQLRQVDLLRHHIKRQCSDP